MRDDVSAAFYALAQRDDAEQLLLASLPVATPAGNLMAAVSGDGSRHILVPVPPGTPITPDMRSRSVTLTRRELMVGEGRRLFIDVACLRPELHDVFERLAGEVCEQVVAHPDDYRTIPQRTLSRWRQLFEVGSASLGGSGLLGIFGELWVLRQMVMNDPSRRIEHWVGPNRAVHDFRRGSVAVEVKTSKARVGRTVEIHGAEQLWPPPSGALYLAFIRCHDAESGTTLRQLVSDIYSSGVDPGAFDDLLARAGLTESSNTPAFEVAEELWYQVDEEFPRIVPGSFVDARVPDGVLNMSYQLNLAGAFPQPLPSGARTSVFEQFAAL